MRINNSNRTICLLITFLTSVLYQYMCFDIWNQVYAHPHGDDSPRLPSHESYTNVDEGEAIGTHLITITASHPGDEPMEYMIDAWYGRDSDDFAIDLRNGAVTTVTELDYEVKRKYKVKIRVMDQYLNHDSMILIILVNNLNEHSPEFSSEGPIRITIPESQEVGSNIGVVINATDGDDIHLDEGKNSLKYSLQDTPDSNYFSLMEFDGSAQLVLSTRLDFEAPVDEDGNNTYSFTLGVDDSDHENASDRNSNPGNVVNTDSIEVIVEVTDVEPENSPPSFTEGLSTSRSIAENTGADSNIGNPILATDPDSSDTLIYQLGGHNAESFRIDENTGQLLTFAALDYQTQQSYEIEVIVSDSSLSVTIRVTILSRTY